MRKSAAFQQSHTAMPASTRTEKSKPLAEMVVIDADEETRTGNYRQILL